MGLSTLHCLVFIVYTGIAGVLGNDQVSGPEDLEITPLEIYLCEGSSAIIPIEIKIQNNLNRLAVDVKFDLVEEMTEYWTINVKAEKWDDGAYNEVYTGEGTTCEMINQYILKGWKKLLAEMKPPVVEVCNMKPGHYEVNGFEVTRPYYDVPITRAGKYKLTYKVYDESETEVLCGVGEYNAVKKS